MNRTLVFIALLVAFTYLAGTAHRGYRRAEIFTGQGTPQTLTVLAPGESKLVSFAPPRVLHTYTGRIGSTDTRVETARRLAPGTAVPVLILRPGHNVPAELLGGRTDRLISNRAGTEPVWFAYGDAQSRTPGNLLKDQPWPELVFHLGWALLLLGAASGGLRLQTSKKKPRVHPVLILPNQPEPTPGAPTPRVVMPPRPPPLPEREAPEPQADLTLRKRSKTEA